MNHICRAIWNNNTQSWVASSELVRGRSKCNRLVGQTLLLGILSTQFIAPAMAFTATVTNEVVNGEVVASGSQTVTTGGVANNTTVSNGASQTVRDGGIANVTILDGQNSSQTVDINGTAHGTIIGNGTWQTVTGGGVSYDASINSGGNQVVLGTGMANDTIINAGMQTVYGTANGSIIQASGEQYIEQNGIAEGSIINGGLQTVTWGTASNATINNGGVQSVYDTANNTTINAGQQTIYNGGVANGTIINNNGRQFIESNGVAYDSTIHTGGEQRVDVGGAVNNTLINGGYQLLFGTANNSVANAGEIYAGAGSILNGTTRINGTATIGGNLITNHGTLAFNPGTQNTVTTEITGTGGLTKVGGGTLILNNTHTYTGGTSVSGGRLIVGGTAADNNASISGTVNVLNGGTLGGYGQIAGPVTVHGGGKVNPGNSVGTLTTGSAHFMSNADFEAHVNPDGSNDKLVASNALGTGTVQIDNGANLVLLGGAGTWSDTTSYTLVDTDSGVTGTFTNVNSNLAFLTPVVDYSNPNQVNLTMERNDTTYGMVGNTYNERNTGSGIESLGSDNPIYQEILSMNASQANNAYNNLSGEIHGSVKSALLENSRYPRHAILEHLDRTAIHGMPETGRNLWINTWAHDGHLKDDGNAARLDNKGAGFIIGADMYQNDITTVGAALGYEQSDLKAGGLRHSDADTKAIHMMAYGQTELGPVDLKGGIGYSWLNVDSKRHVAVGNIMSQNSAKYDAGLVQIFSEGSHTFEINEQARVSHYAGLLYQHLSTDGFTERGAAAQLQGRSSNDNSTSTTLGVRGQWDMNSNSNLYANLGWQHSFGNREPESTLNFIGGMSYNIKGVQTNRDSALIGLGASFDLRPDMSFNVGYDGKFGNQSTDNGAKIGFNFLF